MENKFEVIYEVLDEMIVDIEKQVTEEINSFQFKMELKEKLLKRGVLVDFKDMNELCEHGLPKYSVCLDQTHDDIQKDLVIY